MKVFIIETQLNKTKRYEVLNKTDKQIAEMVKENRIDPKEKLFEASLIPVNKKSFVKTHGV